MVVDRITESVRDEVILKSVSQRLHLMHIVIVTYGGTRCFPRPSLAG